MTISSNDANSLAERKLTAIAAESGSDLEFAIIHRETIETPEGWVFFYNSRQYVESGDLGFALAGNGLIFVDREGIVSTLSSAEPLEVSLKRLSGGV
ncbi:hypothetical protein ABIB82_001861 [Bradyrhizobium sp. i1.8.4]|uniref:YrhB domain-containing protein n=1 Tax=unclassified Bradyrhizobium TaxID=2631580 RepID=UPI003D1B1D53